MKKITALLVCAMILINIACFSVFAAAPTINIIYAKDSSYSSGDPVNISGTCDTGVDVVIRLYDQNSSLIYTDTLLAPDNKTGNYEFKGFNLPTATEKGSLTYKVVVNAGSSEQISSNVAVSGLADNHSGGGDGRGSAAPSLKWDDPLDKVIKDTTKVTTDNQAETKIKEITDKTSEESKKDEDTRSTIATTVETMTSNINTKTVSRSSSNTLSLDDKILTSADLSKLDKTMSVLKSALSKNKLELNRDLFKEQILKVKFDSTKKATLVISKKLIDLLKNIDILTIVDDNFRISYAISDLAKTLGDKDQASIDILMQTPTAAEKTTVKKVSINFNTSDKVTTAKVSFPNIKGDTTYMAVVDEKGNPVGGKYNPATGCIEAKLSESGVYSVVNNEKNFEDIKTKSKDMQDAIKILASKGVINGTSVTKFSPDGAITRAEVAALVLRVLSKLDPNADGKFSDVKQADWFYGVAGSSKQYGLILGYDDNTFRGSVVIPKDQIIVIAARTLQKEMRYKVPTDLNQWLTYADANEIADWAKSEVALATMAGMVTKRTDNKFLPNGDMTRGDAALVLKKLFDKIW